MQSNKFPVKLPYLCASLGTICTAMALKFDRDPAPISFIGRSAICFYISQGIGASVIYRILPYLDDMGVAQKIGIMFAANLTISLLAGLAICSMVPRIRGLLARA